jgi:hypothetical protein
MAFPTGTSITTSNLDAGTDSPASARADLLSAVTALNDIIASANGNSGVLVLTGSAKLPSSTIPTQITLASGVQVINPVSGVVNIRDILRLQPNTVSELTALTSTAGDVAYCSNGAGGNPCVAFYNGTNWVRMSVGATISAT